MPARDRFHNAVKHALVKEGWRITADPLYFEWGGVDLYIDLAAEKIIAAERAGKKIAIEIKTFTAPSLVSDFHVAIGQFVNYRVALQQEEPERLLYLAVPEDTYRSFFALPFVQSVIEQQQVRLLVYDAQQELIALWHE